MIVPYLCFLHILGVSTYRLHSTHAKATPRSVNNYLTFYNSVASNSIHHKSALLSSYGEEESSGNGLKIVAILIIAVGGLFGSDLLNSFNTVKSAALSSNVIEPPSIAQKPKELKKVVSPEDSTRGALTKLSRREINTKLSQIPIFFITRTDINKDIESGSATYLYLNNDNNGLFFLDKNDADTALKSLSIEKSSSTIGISASTLDEVYYPLIIRKQKIGSYMSNIFSKADPNAKYKIIPSASQLLNVPNEWKSKNHVDSVPLFRMKNLAFSKPEGLEIPLFLRKEDAISSYQRLQDSKTNPDSKPIEKVDVEKMVQLASLDNIIDLFSSGGYESRPLEFYPSEKSINDAQNLYEIK
eukprot:gene8864-11957_t